MSSTNRLILLHHCLILMHSEWRLMVLSSKLCAADLPLSFWVQCNNTYWRCDCIINLYMFFTIRYRLLLFEIFWLNKHSIVIYDILKLSIIMNYNLTMCIYHSQISKWHQNRHKHQMLIFFLFSYPYAYRKLTETP